MGKPVQMASIEFRQPTQHQPALLRRSVRADSMERKHPVNRRLVG